MQEYLLALKERQEIARDTMALMFDTVGSGYTFKAGQNANFVLIDPPETDTQGNIRTFSFASSPSNKASLMIAMRMRNSAFKKSLQAIPLGAKLNVTRAMGSFTLHKDSSKPAVFLAGGIGVTPARSIIEWATEERLPHKIYLFCSNRHADGMPFLNDFECFERRNPNFELIATLTDSEECGWRHEFGRIDKQMLSRHLPQISELIYYLVGPPGMVAAMRELLDALGVSEDSVKTEEFGGY